MESSTYPDKKFIAMSRNFVNVVAHSETKHGEREVVAGKEKKMLCKVYWGIPCSSHTTCYQQARSKYDGITGVPATVFADPTGKELFRAGGGLSASELVKKMEEALAKVPGEKISYDQWAGAKKLIEDGNTAFSKEEWKKAVEAWSKVAKMKQKGLQALAEAPLKTAEEKGSEILEEGQSKIESDVEAARKLLKTVSEQFKPLECSKKAAELLKGLDKKK